MVDFYNFENLTIIFNNFHWDNNCLTIFKLQYRNNNNSLIF